MASQLRLRTAYLTECLDHGHTRPHQDNVQVNVCAFCLREVADGILTLPSQVIVLVLETTQLLETQQTESQRGGNSHTQSAVRKDLSSFKVNNQSLTTEQHRFFILTDSSSSQMPSISFRSASPFIISFYSPTTSKV